MSNNSINIIEQVTCFLNEKELCKLEWCAMPNTGMSFYHNKKEYLITKIEDSKITVKDITIKKGGKKN